MTRGQARGTLQAAATGAAHLSQAGTLFGTLVERRARVRTCRKKDVRTGSPPRRPSPAWALALDGLTGVGPPYCAPNRLCSPASRPPSRAPRAPRSPRPSRCAPPHAFAGAYCVRVRTLAPLMCRARAPLFLVPGQVIPALPCAVVTGTLSMVFRFWWHACGVDLSQFFFLVLKMNDTMQK